MNNRKRIIPVLGIINTDLVKTVNFKHPRYLGDPVNAVKILNCKNVDELMIIDIRATKQKRSINFELLEDIASQAFMPLAYGGGIRTYEEAKKIFKIGYEKIVFSSALNTNPDLICKCVNYAGSQSVVASIDIKKSGNNYCVYINSGTKKVSNNLLEYINKVVKLGVGEVIINSIDREGCIKGYDIDLIKYLSSILNIPLVVLGGARNENDLYLALESGANAAAASSMFMFYGKNKAVLISYNIDESKL